MANVSVCSKWSYCWKETSAVGCWRSLDWLQLIRIDYDWMISHPTKGLIPNDTRIEAIGERTVIVNKPETFISTFELLLFSFFFLFLFDIDLLSSITNQPTCWSPYNVIYSNSSLLTSSSSGHYWIGFYCPERTQDKWTRKHLFPPFSPSRPIQSNEEQTRNYTFAMGYIFTKIRYIDI